jgi:UDP-N-acetylmuramate dehydrogenase
MIIHENFQLANILWYKIGGITRYLLQAENEEDVETALDFIEKNHIKRIFICGLGSNIIFPDDYFDGAVIRIVNTKKIRQINRRKDGITTAFAGETLDNLINYSFDNNLVGLQWAGGLPGTVGAGVRGNVGAFGGEIKDRFLSAKVLEYQEDQWNIRDIQKDNFHFAYRHSLIKEQKNLIILSSSFHLVSASSADIIEAKEMYESYINYRKTHHPMEYPSCGSVFKNISDKESVEKVITTWPDIKELVETRWHGKVSMGYIIHRLGLTGYKVGNMQVSEKHSNFIVNLGSAHAQDVITIIKQIQDKVQETFNFTPEVEVEIVK